MNPELNILHLEDNEEDGELIAMALRRHGLTCEIERVKSRGEFVAALEFPGIDLILSDFSLPGFDGLAALELAREKRPNVPFVFVSGTIGEEVAINALQCGASDYVFKHRLPRLGPAVQRAIADADKHRELQRTEKAMIQSEHKYRQIFECMGEAALLAEARSGRIVDTNRQAELLLGRTRAEILGTSIDRVLLPATLDEYRRLLVAQQDSPDRVLFEGGIFFRDGQSIPVAISASPIVLYERHFILGLYRDIGDRQRMTAEMQQVREQHSASTAELEAAQKEIEALSYSVSHDLRAPLRHIDGFARMLLEDHAAQLPPDAQKLLGKVCAGATRLGLLIEALLTFSRLGRQPLVQTTVSLSNLIEEALRDLAPDREGRAVEIRVGELPDVHGDLALLKLVFTHLLSNALKFTRRKDRARIEINCAEENGGVHCRVRDDGAGFDMQYAGRLFGVFQRLHSADQFEGIGIGLAIAQRIIHRHHGRIWAEAEPDKGACFHFTLPFVPTGAAREIGKAAAAEE